MEEGVRSDAQPALDPQERPSSEWRRRWKEMSSNNEDNNNKDFYPRMIFKYFDDRKAVITSFLDL